MRSQASLRDPIAPEKLREFGQLEDVWLECPKKSASDASEEITLNMVNKFLTYDITRCRWLTGYSEE